MSFLPPAWQRRLERHPVLIPALLLAVWLAFTAGWRSLMLPDEGRYASIALTMAQNGNWGVPLLNHLPFFHKPILFYWITGGALKLFGATVWAARAASLVGAWLAGMGLYLFVRRHGNPLQAQWAGLALAVLAGMPFFFVGAQFANTDMLVAGMISATILAAAHAVLQAAQGLPHLRWVWLAYALAALGVLSKGLIGAVLPAGVLVLWLVWQQHWRGLRVLLSASGLLVFLAVGLPWFVWMEQHSPGFFHYFFIYQQFQRFTQAAFNNRHGVWFYPAVLLVLGLPWSLWLALPLRRWWCLRKSGLAVPLWQPAPMVCALSLQRLFGAWTLVIVGFFSIPASKLVGYMLPVLPPLAALLAYWLLAYAPGARLVKATLAISAMLCMLLVLAGANLPAANRKSAEMAAHAMRKTFAPNDQIVMLGSYQYDLPFYLQARQPVWVVDDWPEVAFSKRDNWQKELYESGEFNRTLRGQILIGQKSASLRLCQKLQDGQPLWLMARRTALPNNAPALQAATPFWQKPGDADFPAVWHLQGDAGRAALGCGA